MTDSRKSREFYPAPLSRLNQKAISNFNSKNKIKNNTRLRSESGAGFYVICDNIRSLENIGSIFRTADALSVTKIFLCGISGRPPHNKISKTALGAEKTVTFE